MSEHQVPKVQLTIRLEPNGEITVMGPIEDKIFCLGIMEIAKRIILNFNPEKKKIIVPEIVPPKL